MLRNEWATSISTGSVSSTSFRNITINTASNACIVYSSTSGGAGTDIFGTVSPNSIVYTTNTALQKFYRTSTRSFNTTYVAVEMLQCKQALTNCSAQLPNFTGNDRVYVIIQVLFTSNLAITGHNVTFQIGSGSATSLTVNSGVTFSLPGSILMQQGSTLTNNGTISAAGNISYSIFGYLNYIDIQNNGLFNVYGKITQPQTSFSRIYNNSNGIINLFGDYSKDQNSWFYNSGIFNLYNSEVKSNANSDNVFENSINGIININNKINPTKLIKLIGLNLTNNFLLKPGSQFIVSNSNMLIENSHGILEIEGLLSIQDGNLDYVSGGATINIPDGGELYMFDTDNNKDGVLDLSNGGINLTVDGEAYMEGITVNNGGGSTINVQDGGEVFIGNVGLYTGLNNNEIKVFSGGTLYYCGNKTPVDEKMGVIYSGGTLNYANGYYTTETPGSQLDFYSKWH